ncbi:MAG: hypothetical protein IT292_08080 [Deltaproteobacteria bacterium]|nr:hypothetical protein [Deltaproteobacteria bacterium]
MIEYFSPKSQTSKRIGVANEMGFRHVAFAICDIEAVVEKLKIAGVQFVSDIQSFPKNGKRLVYLYGPDNILMELAQYRD